MKYFCPVCGYDSLSAPPAYYNICPCCGTEFGYDDVSRKWSELRELWLKRGAPWFSRYTQAPEGWSASAQMANLAQQSVSAESTVETVGYPQLLQDGVLLSETIGNDRPFLRGVTITDQENAS
jgi:hypothetical protein